MTDTPEPGVKHLREVAVRVVTTHWDCGIGDCKGEMLPNGHHMLDRPDILAHKCTLCGHYEYAEKRYPVAAFQPAKPQDAPETPTFMGYPYRRLRHRPGDRYVLTIDRPISDENVARIRNGWLEFSAGADMPLFIQQPGQTLWINDPSTGARA